MNEIKFNSLIPELSVKDINKSKDFYLKIGFHVLYERKEDKFCFLELEDNQIMIEEINDYWNTGSLEYPFGIGNNISLSVLEVNKLSEIVKNNNIPLFLDIETHEYKVNDKIYYDKEFLIQDVDGYLLRFNNK